MRSLKVRDVFESALWPHPIVDPTHRQGTSRAGKVHLDENLMSSIVVRISLHMRDEVAADEQHKTLVGESM